jgi:hypothetical protein
MSSTKFLRMVNLLGRLIWMGAAGIALYLVSVVLTLVGLFIWYQLC